jgi:cytochrome P450
MRWPISLEHYLVQELTQQVMDLISSLLLMGLVQTAVGITTAIMAAACHPLAQAKVHEELDMIVGSDRGKAKKEIISPSRLIFW